MYVLNNTATIIGVIRQWRDMIVMSTYVLQVSTCKSIMYLSYRKKNRNTKEKTKASFWYSIFNRLLYPRNLI